MQQSKKNESVKTGLKIAGHPGTTEKDADELMHEQPPTEKPDTSSERDLDELVHEQSSTIATNNLEERDPDDLVHEKDNDGDEQA